MTPYTYYFLISLSLLVGVLVYFLNVLTIRLGYKTLLGYRMKPNSAEYKRVLKLASGRVLAVMCIVGLVLLINLTISIHALQTLENRVAANGVIIGGSIAVALLGIVILVVQSRTLSDSINRSNKK